MIGFMRERFDALDHNFNPGTIHSLSEIGVSGGGSISEGLCKQVGRDGKVIAIDLNTRFVGALDYENLEVREQNLITEELLEAEYDLLHTRFTLFHIPERDSVLAKMVWALKPGV
jgi:ubiquinone/menaquinone biosynthesis C-methylase UbiE